MRVIGLGATIAYPTLLALGALDAAGYSVIAPVLPQIAARTGVGPAVIGLLVAAFPLGIVVGFPLAGRAVRRRGTREVQLGSPGLLAVGSLGFVIGSELSVFFLARFVMGSAPAGCGSPSRSAPSSGGLGRNTSA